MKFTEAKLEQAFIELLENEGYPHFVGSSLVRSSEDEVLIEGDLKLTCSLVIKMPISLKPKLNPLFCNSKPFLRQTCMRATRK